jgi:hypothetical protein
LGQCWLAGLAGGGLATVAALGFFLLHDGGAHLWECTIQFNRYYAASQNLRFEAIGSRLHGFWTAWPVLFLMPWAAGFTPRKRTWFWAGMFACTWLTTSGSYYGHYYIIVMPFWALLTVLGIGTLADLVTKRLPAAVHWARAALTAMVLLMVCAPDVAWLSCSPEQFALKKLGGSNPFLESPIIAQKMAQLSSPEDVVFIAGSEPQILCYARRQSASRFVIVYPLMIPTPLALGFQQEAIQELEQHPPALILLVRPSTSWLKDPDSPPVFLNYLGARLSRDYVPVGGYVGESGNGHWQEPLTDEAGKDCRLVLFKRK